MGRRIAPAEPGGVTASLADDAQRYVQTALEQGAGAAAVVPAAALAIDERVALKCSVPKCFGYNTCANCPPHSPSPEQMRVVLARYQTSVVFRVEVPASVIVRDRQTIDERVAAYKKTCLLVNALESAAFYDGHYLATGFAAGSCKSTFCHNLPCAVLAGEKCRHNLIARPSMEAVGIDCFAVAYSLGWTMYPVGSSATADEVPAASLMGLVLIA